MSGRVNIRSRSIFNLDPDAMLRSRSKDKQSRTFKTKHRENWDLPQLSLNFRGQKLFSRNWGELRRILIFPNFSLNIGESQDSPRFSLTQLCFIFNRDGLCYLFSTTSQDWEAVEILIPILIEIGGAYPIHLAQSPSRLIMWLCVLGFESW